MTTREKDLAAQNKVVEQLIDELSRLNTQFDTMLTDGGLSGEGLQQALNEKHTLQVQDYLDKAKDDAVRAGQARAAQAAPATGKASSAVGRGRPGMIRL